MEPNERINLNTNGEFETKIKMRKPSSESEDAALKLIKQFLPTELRASEKTFEIGYEKAYMLYNAGKYSEALSHFQLLAAGHPENPKYIFAIAACYHMMKNYQKAVQIYTTVSILDPENPLPFYYSADCFTKMLDPFGALICLDVGVKRGKNRKYTTVIERMQSMIHRLERELGEKEAQSAKSFITPT